MSSCQAREAAIRARLRPSQCARYEFAVRFAAENGYVPLSKKVLPQTELFKALAKHTSICMEIGKLTYIDPKGVEDILAMKMRVFNLIDKVQVRNGALDLFDLLDADRTAKLIIVLDFLGKDEPLFDIGLFTDLIMALSGIDSESSRNLVIDELYRKYFGVVVRQGQFMMEAGKNYPGQMFDRFNAEEYCGFERTLRTLLDI